MNEALVPVAWMTTGVVITVIVAAAAVAITGRINSPQAAGVMRELIAAGSIIRLVTMLSIVAVLGALCWMDKIKGDATVAALSAIAGYVLGNERAARADRQ